MIENFYIQIILKIIKVRKTTKIYMMKAKICKLLKNILKLIKKKTIGHIQRRISKNMFLLNKIICKNSYNNNKMKVKNYKI
jgi:hypothetical protein